MPRPDGADYREDRADRSQDEESKEVGGAEQHGASVANYAWCRTHDRACDRGFCSGNEELPTQTGLWRLVGSCAAPALFGRQRAVGAYIKDRSGRHSTPADYWCNASAELDGRKSIPEGSWLAQLLSRKPRMLVAIALAYKMAHAVWAMLTKNERCRDPTSAKAAAG